MARVELMLFDLDGTLADSAPDLAGAANQMRTARGLPPLPFAALRPMVGSGARGMLGVAFGLTPGDAEYEPMRQEFLQRYEARLLHETALFPTITPLLDALDGRGLRWGIVTNKALRLATPMAEGLALAQRSAVLIGGDTTPFTKPRPEPLLEAARRLQVDPARCAYLGDDRRDVQAGRAAGMATLAATWGYLGADTDVAGWGADAVVDHPDHLLNWLDMA